MHLKNINCKIIKFTFLLYRQAFKRSLEDLLFVFCTGQGMVNPLERNNLFFHNPSPTQKEKEVKCSFNKDCYTPFLVAKPLAYLYLNIYQCPWETNMFALIGCLIHS